MDSPDHQTRDGPQLELPDIEAIVRSFKAITAELTKIRNIPAYDLGAAILTEMRETRQEIREIREDFQRKTDHFDCRLKAMDVNNVARLINSTLVDADEQLSCLRNVATNEPIDHFPATPRAIESMSNAALDTVLGALGVEIDGQAEQKRQRLRVQIGLKADPA